MACKNTKMIRNQILCRGVRDPRVIRAMVRTDRGLYVPLEQQEFAYADHPVPLLPGASVSQPFIVALMTDLLEVRKEHKVLEIGAGSGYQAAVLSRLAREVWAVEVQPELVEFARGNLLRDKRQNVNVVTGDGWKGLAEEAPFDRILLAAAPGTVPRALLEQLAVGGRMVAPVGARPLQNLEIIEKGAAGDVSCTKHSMVQFVPLVHPDVT